MTQSFDEQCDRQALVQRGLQEHRRWLATVLLARGISRGEVDELLQQVSIAALQSADRLHDPAKLAPWLYRVAVLTALQYRRRQGRRRKLVERLHRDPAAASPPIEPDPLAWLIADEQRELVRKAIKHLPARDAEILLLKHTEDWSYRQLAEHLGISTSAVDARLHRARQKLRQALATVAPALVPR